MGIRITAVCAALVTVVIISTTTVPAFADPVPEYSITTTNPSLGIGEFSNLSAEYPSGECSFVIVMKGVSSAGMPCAWIPEFSDQPYGRFVEAAGTTVTFELYRSINDLDVPTDLQGSVDVFIEPSAVASSESTATATVVAGTYSSALEAFGFSKVNQNEVGYSHTDQLLTGSSILRVDDSSGTGLGWNVTEEVTDVSWASAAGAVSGVEVTAADYAITSIDSVFTEVGQEWTAGSAVAGSLDSPVTVLSAAEGAGSGLYSVPVNFSLQLPATSRIGTYTATLTTTMSLAP